MFDHERLDAYRLALDFAAWWRTTLDRVPRARRPVAIRHLDDASTSIALNIAEGNGKRSIPDRVRYLETARGSALECSACLDILVVRGVIDGDAAQQGKQTLVRVVSTVTQLIASLLRRE